MDETILLVADVLRRKLPAAEIPPGEQKLAGTALVDLDVTVAKSAPTEAKPNLPWKAIVAALARSMGDTAAGIIARAARKAVAEDGKIPLPQSVEMALEKVRDEMPAEPREGPTKIAGLVEVVGFAPSSIALPGWVDMKAAIAAARKM